ncbi:MAG: surface lipoprotein assembly modifier, partial [Paracoccaceae bacterium]
GGAAYTNYRRATVGQKFRLTNATGLDLFAGYEHQVSLLSGGVKSEIYSLGTTVSHQLASKDMIGATLRLQQTRSADPGTENTQTRAELRYGIAKPIMGTQLALKVSVEHRNYDYSVYDTAGRQDLTFSAGTSLTFLNTDYFGFSPAISIEANRTNSSVDLFDRETFALRFGLQSVF